MTDTKDTITEELNATGTVESDKEVTAVETSDSAASEASCNTIPEDSNESPVVVPKAIRRYKKPTLRFTTANVSVEAAGEAYLAGQITAKEWSLMSNALRKAVERYAKKHKRSKKAAIVETPTEASIE